NGSDSHVDRPNRQPDQSWKRISSERSEDRGWCSWTGLAGPRCKRAKRTGRSLRTYCPAAHSRSPGNGRSISYRPAQPTRGDVVSACRGRNLSLPRIHGRGWSYELRAKSQGFPAPSRLLYRPDPQGRETSKRARAAADQARIRHQRANGEDTRHHGAANAARSRRRGDRMKIRRRDFITLLSGVAAGWPLAVKAQHQTKATLGWLDL